MPQTAAPLKSNTGATLKPNLAAALVAPGTSDCCCGCCPKTGATSYTITGHLVVVFHSVVTRDEDFSVTAAGDPAICEWFSTEAGDPLNFHLFAIDAGPGPAGYLLGTITGQSFKAGCADPTGDYPDFTSAIGSNSTTLSGLHVS